MSCVGYRVKYIGYDPIMNQLKGTVVEDISTKFAKVEFDNGSRFTVKKINIVKINESEEDNMGRLEGYYAVAVTEERTGYGKKDYYYAIFDDGNTYKIGDRILVSGSNKDILTIKDIITLEEAKEKGRKDITAEVVCKVDIIAYENRVEERKEKEKRKKEADKIKKQMDKMIAEMDQSKRYEMYASENPELAEKLKEYKELINE